METLRKASVIQNNWPVLLNNLFNRDSFKEGNLTFFDQQQLQVPAVNIHENARSFMIEVVAPGMSKEDFNVELDGNKLTVSAEKNTQDESTGDSRYLRQEFSYQSIKRSFTIPQNVVDLDKISAQHIDGILRLEIPKIEEAQQKHSKRIEIS